MRNFCSGLPKSTTFMPGLIVICPHLRSIIIRSSTELAQFEHIVCPNFEHWQAKIRFHQYSTCFVSILVVFTSKYLQRYNYNIEMFAYLIYNLTWIFEFRHDLGKAISSWVSIVMAPTAPSLARDDIWNLVTLGRGSYPVYPSFGELSTKSFQTTW